MSESDRTSPGILTDQQRSSLRFLHHPTRHERLALQLDELFRAVGRHVAAWNARPGPERLRMRLKYGSAATIHNFGRPTFRVLGEPSVAVRMDDDFTDRQFEFRFEVSILDAPDPDEAIGKVIEIIAGDIDRERHDRWKLGDVRDMLRTAVESN